MLLVGPGAVGARARPSAGLWGQEVVLDCVVMVVRVWYQGTGGNSDKGWLWWWVCLWDM